MPTVSTFSNYGRCSTPDKKRLPVDVDRVTKRFRPMMSRLPGFRGKTSFTSVNRVSFQVGLGEMVGLLGPNGAGKTTLLKMIATLISPSEGQIRFFGKDNRSSAVRERGLVGLVTCDERSFYWRLTGWQNLMFFAALYRIPKKIAGQRSGELLDALGLSHAANRRFDSYSAGMKQKLAIARGLLADPAIVLYDEPTRSLDPLSQKNIRQWIREKRSRSPRQAHLIATHHLAEAEELCDRVVIISRGEVLIQGSFDHIRREFPGCASDAYHLTIDWGKQPISFGAREAFEQLMENDPYVEGGVIQDDTLKPVQETIQRYVFFSVVDTLKWQPLLERVWSLGGKILRTETIRPDFEEIFCKLVHNTQDRNHVSSSGTDLFPQTPQVQCVSNADSLAEGLHDV